MYHAFTFFQYNMLVTNVLRDLLLWLIVAGCGMNFSAERSDWLLHDFFWRNFPREHYF